MSTISPQAPEEVATSPETTPPVAARPRPTPSAGPRIQPKTNPWLRDFKQLLRRGHLYAGLLMLPWVFLYGITGLLFNHPTLFSDQTFLTFGQDETKGTPLEKVPTAAEVAAQVVAAINARGGEEYQLVSPENARFERGGLGASVIAGDGKPYSVILGADGMSGSVRGVAGGGRGGAQGGSMPAAKGKREGRESGESKGEGRGEMRGGREGESRGEMRGGREGEARGGREGEGRGEGRGGRGGEGRGGRGGEGRGGREAGPAAPFEVREGLTLAQSPLNQLEKGLPLVLAKIGLDRAEVSEVRAAPLSFLMEGGGERWVVNYLLQSGTVTGRPADAATAGELSARRFLLGLHVAHGYPSTFNARWVWAVIVDVMSVIMVFWGVSGIVMWWQIKKTRRLGTIVMAVSIIAAAFVGVGMHGLMIVGGR